MQNQAETNDIQQSLTELENNEIFSAEFRKKRLISYTIRTVLTIVLYVVFWKYKWLRWTLVVVIPLNLISLVSIFGWSYFLKRKIEKIKTKM